MEEAPHGMEIISRYFSAFTGEQLAQFSALESLYNEWNARINVISRKDIGGLYEKHVLHSLSIAAVFDFRPGSRVIDIGTGGGFPGIPLAIFFPDTHFHLVDSIGKKLKVVEAVTENLGLQNVTTMHTRAEEIQGRKFDAAVSRAVAPLTDLWKWSKPLLRRPPDANKERLAAGLSAPDSNKEDSAGHSPATGSAGQGPAADLPFASGLICLKGGDLAAEISESGTRPRVREIYQLFPEAAFVGKYIVQVPVGLH
jgi:16S rRNA (guanine527-N7)-methyltransferase